MDHHKSLVLALLLACLPVTAADQRIENMAAHCKSVMDSGVCRVALDPKDYPNATIPVILGDGSVRRIDKKIYLAVRATGFAKDADGNWLMCLKVYEACEQWNSDACLAVRSLWRQ
jgi:hypothetical protein